MKVLGYLKARKGRTAAIALAILGGMLVLSAAGGTNALFSDTHNGTITGTVGSIRITPSGGSGTDSMDFAFSNLLPGEPQSVTLHYQNTGANTEDVWLKFPNATALSALNNLGTYGEVHIVSNGTEVFASTNLNDRVATCGTLSPSGCWPVPAQLPLASHVAPGASGWVTFSFNYASKLKTQGPGPWNSYPVPAGQYSPSNPDGQTTVNAADGTGSGLPWQLVATQVGQQP